MALYDYSGNSEDDLSFQQGDRILISQHIDAEWSRGQLNGREGMFPRAFVESSAGMTFSSRHQFIIDMTELLPYVHHYLLYF